MNGFLARLVFAEKVILRTTRKPGAPFPRIKKAAKSGLLRFGLIVSVGLP